MARGLPTGLGRRPTSYSARCAHPVGDGGSCGMLQLLCILLTMRLMSIVDAQMCGDILCNTMLVEVDLLSRLDAMVLHHVGGNLAAPARGIRAARKGGHDM